MVDSILIVQILLQYLMCFYPLSLFHRRMLQNQKSFRFNLDLSSGWLEHNGCLLFEQYSIYQVNVNETSLISCFHYVLKGVFIFICI